TTGETIQLISACVTFAAVVVALFQARIAQLLTRSRLRVLLHSAYPDILKGPLRTKPGHGEVSETDCYFVRATVRNEGTSAVRDVEAFASLLEAEGPTKQWHRVDLFIPMNLSWAHGEGEGAQETRLGSLNPKCTKQVDLFRVLDPARRRFFPDNDKQIDGV